MDIIVNKKNIKLAPNDYLAEGGEGKIFVKKNTAFKIYNDINRMIPFGKIQELSALQNPNIIKPEHVIFDHNKPIGYTMRYVNGAYSLCQLFPDSFWQRNNLDATTALALVKKLYQDLAGIHAEHILVVDLNELNVLISDDFQTPYWIDVDSWQTKSFPAMSIMESIRDRHSTTFTPGTDWFSLAIVTFQLLIGIHPYKGKYEGMDLEERMIKNISVFNSKVKIPKACRPFDLIPPNLRNWYQAVFERGLRQEPPRDFQGNVFVNINTTVTNSANLTFTLIHEFDKNILAFFHSFQESAVITESGLYLNNAARPLGGLKTKSPHVVYFNSQPFLAWVDNGIVQFYNISERKLEKTFSMNIQKIMSYNNAIYAQCSEDLIEFSPEGPFIASRIVGKVLENATRMYDGVFIQDMLGMYYASFFPNHKEHQQIKIKELSGYRIVNAKYDKKFLTVVGVKNGKYDKFIFRFDSNYLYDILKQEDVHDTDINFVALDNGIAIQITPEEEIEILGPKGSPTKKIQNEHISATMKLYNEGKKVLVSVGNKLYQITTK